MDQATYDILIFRRFVMFGDISSVCFPFIPNTRCYRCQQHGHMAKNCLNAPKCRKCSIDHETRDCKMKFVDNNLNTYIFKRRNDSLSDGFLYRGGNLWLWIGHSYGIDQWTLFHVIVENWHNIFSLMCPLHKYWKCSKDFITSQSGMFIS